MHFRRTLCGVAASLLLCLPHNVSAQSGSPFEAVVRVDESVITRFEIDQRLRFLEVLRQPDVTRQTVTETLIEERLKLAEARRRNFALTEDQLQLAMEEFASRANLTSEEFITAIGRQGVAPESFRDFVQAGAAWRELVRQRFASRARVSEDELNRAIALGTGQGSVQVLLSEIVLPLSPETAADTRQNADAIQEIDSIAEFSQAARQVSIAPTAASGGDVGWMPLSQLPPTIAPLFLTMAPGDVTAPVPLPGVEAIALFQLRGLRDGRPAVLQNVNLEYMLVRTPPGEAAALAAELEPKVSTCDTIFSLVADPDESRVSLVSEPRTEAVASLRAVIDTLDPGELSPLPGNAALVMLCDRTPILGEDLSRDDLQQRLFTRKLEDFADGYLAELRANAYIVRN